MQTTNTPTTPALTDLVKISKAAHNPSGKGPAFYAQLRKNFIKSIFEAPETIIRLFAANSPYAPTSFLDGALRYEKEPKVVRALLRNPNTSKRAVAQTLLAMHNTDMDVILAADTDLMFYLNSLDLSKAS